MIKAVFFDIDGTLYDNSQRVSDKTYEAIDLMRERGILCGIATGRSPQSISHLIDHFDVISAFNGQIITIKQKLFYQSFIHPQDLKTIYSYAKDYNKRLYLGTKHNRELGSLNTLPKWMAKGVHSLAFKVMRSSFVRSIVFNNYTKPQYPMTPVYQCVLYIPYHESIMLQNSLHYSKITYSNPFSVDIISKENSKLESIKRICDHFNIKMNEVLAFGDGINDLEMLAGVGYGVAMKNGDTEIKAIADYVTDSNESEGIYKALHHFKLID